MALEKTLAIIKPDSVEKGIIGELIVKMSEADLKVVGMKMLHLTEERAKGFYAVHEGKPFFEDLVQFMISDPVVVLVLEGEDAINKWRMTMGSTNPDEAEDGTIRKDFGTDVGRNAVHGSDASATANFEMSYFFESNDIYSYEWD